METPGRHEHFGTTMASMKDVIVTSGMSARNQALLLEAFKDLDPDGDPMLQKGVLLISLADAVTKINPEIFSFDNQMKRSRSYGEKADNVDEKLSGEDQVVLMAFQEIREKLTK